MKLFTALFLLSSALVTVNALASDLVCEGTASETTYPGHQIPTAGQPLPPATVTTYRLILAINGVGTPGLKLNASLTTTVMAPNGGSNLTIVPIASLTNGVAGVRAVHSNGSTVLFNSNGIWVVSMDEAMVQGNAGKANIFQMFVNSGNLPSVGTPGWYGQIDKVDCVAF